jgi:hypothetical protein
MKKEDEIATTAITFPRPKAWRDRGSLYDWRDIAKSDEGVPFVFLIERQ